MGNYYLLCFFMAVQAMSHFPTKLCDIETDSTTKQCFLKETVVSMAHSPNQLAVDTITNSLYLSFDSGQGEYIPAVVKIETKKLTVLRGVKDAFALAYDAAAKEMYFGGSHGIYKYNPATKRLNRLGIGNLDIWWLVIKKNIYFIKFPSLFAYYYENRTIKNIPQLRSKMLHQFVFDHEDNMFFINTTGLYGVRNDSDEAILLRDRPRFSGMAIDNKGHIYVCSDDAIFQVSKMVQKVKKLLNIQGVLGLAFDKNNNMIYSDSHEVTRLIAVSNNNYYDTVNRIPS